MGETGREDGKGEVCGLVEGGWGEWGAAMSVAVRYGDVEKEDDSLTACT